MSAVTNLEKKGREEMSGIMSNLGDVQLLNPNLPSSSGAGDDSSSTSSSIPPSSRAHSHPHGITSLSFLSCLRTPQSYGGRTGRNSSINSSMNARVIKRGPPSSSSSSSSAPTSSTSIRTPSIPLPSLGSLGSLEEKENDSSSNSLTTPIISSGRGGILPTSSNLGTIIPSTSSSSSSTPPPSSSSLHPSLPTSNSGLSTSGHQAPFYHFPGSLLRGNGTLSPPLLRTDPTVPPGCQEHGVALIGGKYLMLDQLEGSNLHRCIDIQTQQEFACKTVSNDPSGQALLAAHYRVDGHPAINPVREVLVGEKITYLFFPACSVDLHSYVRTRRRLREPQARNLFRQIVSAVHQAHLKGIVLRDLKLRKFVFTNESRTELKLESLEDAIVLEDDTDDLLSDKHGCPAYVSPEILKINAQYSGRAADMWGLGVMLYTMLVGRYPFHGQEHTGLFAKIRRGQFNLPESISSRAKCLIRCLLRKEPEDRLTTEDVLIHPWLTQTSSRERIRRYGNNSESMDHAVPENANFNSISNSITSNSYLSMDYS